VRICGLAIRPSIVEAAEAYRMLAEAYRIAKIFASADSNIVRKLLENRSNPPTSTAGATGILLTDFVRSD
jgi:hypothetical protein